MIEILKHFGWTWVGLLVSDDDYGFYVAQSFISDLADSGEGCLAYLEVLPRDNEPVKLRRIVEIMKKSTARVVIVFAHEAHSLNLMEEVGLDINYNSMILYNFFFIELNDLVTVTYCIVIS